MTDRLEDLLAGSQVDGRVTAELARRVLHLAREEASKELAQRDQRIEELERENGCLREDATWNRYH